MNEVQTYNGSVDSLLELFQRIQRRVTASIKRVDETKSKPRTPEKLRAMPSHKSQCELEQI